MKLSSHHNFLNKFQFPRPHLPDGLLSRPLRPYMPVLYGAEQKMVGERHVCLGETEKNNIILLHNGIYFSIFVVKLDNASLFCIVHNFLVFDFKCGKQLTLDLLVFDHINKGNIAEESCYCGLFLCRTQ